jgi:catechol 2,3-dioxygenase-like lactoylglutathione lyase family enzyme
MKRFLAHIALLVRDYDEAIEFYVGKLGFILIEDTILSETKRWVLVAPSESSQCGLLLAKAASPEQLKQVGDQSAGRVFLFLNTDTFQSDYQNLIDQHITIEREPVIESYGKVVVFSDLYGNLWDLIEPAQN